jgi:hypothetical protein
MYGWKVGKNCGQREKRFTRPNRADSVMPMPHGGGCDPDAGGGGVGRGDDSGAARGVESILCGRCGRSKNFGIGD